MIGTRVTGGACPLICELAVIGEESEAASWIFCETEERAFLSAKALKSWFWMDGEACFKLLTISKRFLRISVFNNVYSK